MTTAQAMTTTTTMTGQKTTGRATMMATEMVWTTETMTRRMDEPWLLLLAAVALRRISRSRLACCSGDPTIRQRRQP